VGGLVQLMDANCKRQYNETSIQNTINGFPEHRRKLMQVNLDVRITAECQCMPEKLRNLDDKQFVELEGKDLKKSLYQMIGETAESCLAEGYRKQWIPLCHAIMLPETDNQQKISEACQCINGEIQKISNVELMQFSNNALKFNKLAENERAVNKRRKNEIEKSFEACAEKAGIEENSEYKKRFKMARAEESRVTLAKVHMKTIAIALDRYRLDNYKYPGQKQGLAVLTIKLPNKKNSPYIQKLNKDPWGNAYVYRVLETGNNFELLSYGRDKKPEGSGSDQDLYHNR